jgi:hypothetical protein
MAVGRPGESGVRLPGSLIANETAKAGPPKRAGSSCPIGAGASTRPFGTGAGARLSTRPTP